MLSKEEKLAKWEAMKREKEQLVVCVLYQVLGARCSSVVREFAHGAMGRRIDPSWSGPIELLLVPAKGARCNSVGGAFAHGAMGRRINPSWGGSIELFLVPASAPRLV